jgi:hypothetical protein
MNIPEREALSMRGSVRVLFSFTLVLLLAGLSFASTPDLLSYQARALDSDGEPVADGNYAMTFAIFDAAVGGAQKWSETQPNVAVTAGLFSVLLGTVEPLVDTVFDGAERYLQVTVGGEPVMPRTQLTSAAYSQRVSTIDGAIGGEIAAPVYVLPQEFLDEAARSGSSAALTVTEAPRIQFGFNTGGDPTISLYEPIDSKAGRAGFAGETQKKIEMSQDGIFLFGQTEFDTTLLVAPNGDIIGKGQITMGENSSSGTQTTVLGFENTADGDSSTIGGGSANATTGTISTIGGGHGNTTTGDGATIGGGAFNSITGWYATIAGGFGNSAGGDYSTIPGGDANTSDGAYSYAAGHRAKALHAGSFVWADQTDEDFLSTGEDQFLIRAGGGVGIGTNTPIGLFDVSGFDGDSSVNLPVDAIASAEILDEPGISADRSSVDYVLTQGAASMEQILTTTITTPAAGYVVVRGGTTLELFNTNKQNVAYVQIDDTPGGSPVNPYFVLAGAGDSDAPERKHYFSAAAERIFMVPAGTHTFYLEAQAHVDNGDGAVTTLQRPHITATYIPSSYGTVTGFAGANSARGFGSAEPVGDLGNKGADAKADDLYRFDLRELELQVLEARLAAEKAEKALLQAKLRELYGTGNIAVEQ